MKVSRIHIIVSKDNHPINFNIVCRLIGKDNGRDRFYIFNYIYSISSSHLSGHQSCLIKQVSL